MSSGSPTEACAAKLSGVQRTSRWKSMILKILMIFQVFEVKNKAKMLLGAEAYNRVFPQAKAVETQEETKKKVTRIIKGEVVGRPLATLAKGKREEQATMTAELCPHPEDKMKREGNRNSRIEPSASP